MTRSFTVYGEPQGKGRPKITTKGGHPHGYTPAKTAAYERSVATAYKFQYPVAKPLTGAIELRIEAYMPIPQSWPKSEKAAALAGLKKPKVKPDVDNIGKAIADSLNGIAYLDDKQITVMRVSKVYGALPRVDVEIWWNEDEEG